jgi:1-acyl-sn-glycerol-3-phosphate acyltransferase
MSKPANRAEPNRAADWVYHFVYWLVGWIARLTWRYTVTGREHVPVGTAYIVVANHLSVFDAPAIFLAMTERAWMFGADKWRRVPGIRQLLEAVGVIWVARGEADMDAMKASLAVLKGGGRLGVAPEGTRSPTGALIRGKPGAAFLADRAKVPLVPMAIWGTEDVIPCWKRLRRPRIHCVIGPAFTLPGSGRAKGPELDELTEIIMLKLAAMLPPKYRGVYKDHPRLSQFDPVPSVISS